MKASLKALLQQTQSNELLSLDDKRLDLLVQLVEQLDKWNKAYNLTSVRDPKQMLSRHIVDSLVVSPFYKVNGSLMSAPGDYQGYHLLSLTRTKRFSARQFGKRIALFASLSQLNN